MVQMAFCDLSHTFHKQVANVSQHVFVILLWGILTSPLTLISIILNIQLGINTGLTVILSDDYFNSDHPL